MIASTTVVRYVPGTVPVDTTLAPRTNASDFAMIDSLDLSHPSFQSFRACFRPSYYDADAVTDCSQNTLPFIVD
jgi:hypothetical protein